MKNKKVFIRLLIALTVLALLMSPLILVVDNIEATPDFIIESETGENEIYKAPEINWSKFWTIFRNHAYWSLEGWHPGQEQWVENNSFLDVHRDYVADNKVKITLNFTAPYTTDYRLTFAIDAKVRNYVNKTDNHEYILSFPIDGTYLTVAFNWSDMLSIPGLIYNHGIKNINGDNYFWFRVRKNNVQEGAFVSLDPTTEIVDISDSFSDYNHIGNNIVRAGNGTLYAIFVANTSLHCAYSLDNGTTWTDNEVYTNDSYVYMEHSSAVIDRNDVIHVVVSRSLGGGYSPAYFNSTDWQPNYLVLGTGNQWPRPDIAIDGNDKLHVVYEHDGGASNDNQIAYMNSTDGGLTWSEKQILTNESDSADDEWYSSIGVDTNGYVHIAYFMEDYYSGNNAVGWMLSTDSGATWTDWEDNVLTESDESTSCIALTCGDDGKTYVVYRIDNALVYAYYDGGWSSLPYGNLLGYYPGHDRLDISYSSDGILHVGYTHPDTRLLYYGGLDISEGEGDFSTDLYWNNTLRMNILSFDSSLYPISNNSLTDNLRTNIPLTGFMGMGINNTEKSVNFIYDNLTLPRIEEPIVELGDIETYEFEAPDQARADWWVIYDGNGPCYVTIEYGYTTDYGNSTIVKTDAETDDDEWDYINSLTEGRVYNARIKINNSAYTNYSANIEFCTYANKTTNINVSTYNRTAINISWTPGINSNATIIKRSTTNYTDVEAILINVWPTSEIYNGTGTTYNDTDLNPGTNYYYYFWSYANWSYHKYYNYPDYGTGDETTDNIAPEFDNESVTPSNGIESDTLFNFTCSYQDPDDGDPETFQVLIERGAWSLQEDMIYISGDNTTGSEWYYETTLPTTGTYDFEFIAEDPFEENESESLEVEVTANTSFDTNFPTFLEVGQYIMSWGTLKNTSGGPLDSIWVYTKILDSTDWSTVPESNHDYYVKNGQYMYVFSTSTMLPGIYYINVNYTYGGTDFFTNWTLYLSDFTGPGHIATNAYFTFYNNNTGVGIDALSFKVYVDDTVPLDANDRIYGNVYPNTYTGQTLYYRIDDYFDNQIYPTTGTYDTVIIEEIDEFVDVPIDWYSFSVKNMNHSIIKFTITNATRNYSQYLYPYEPFYWNLLEGDYNITMDYYNAVTGAFEQTVYDDISITTDTYYWIAGYDLRDIIIEIVAVNSSIDTLSIDITAGVELTNSAVNNISLRLSTNLSVMESNITALNNQIWNAINISDSVIDYINNTIFNDIQALNLTVDYINNTIWTEISLINSTVDYFNSTIFTDISLINSTVTGMNTHVVTMWNMQNSSFNNLENRSVVKFSFYNTNQGLGLDRETLKILVNGSRLIGDTYYCYNASDKINLTIKDFYNNTLYHNNFTITAPYTFIDLGLTFHSWLFGNKNNDYYMVSILKEGASRWWEKGVTPYNDVEFLIPSGNYTMRIYGSDYVDIHNTSYTINNSRVYIIHGTNLTQIISGQSIIRGQLLELQNDLYEATLPEIVSICYNPPSIYSLFKTEGALLGTKLVCPALFTMATTENTSSFTGTTVVYPLIPVSNTDNGTITVKDDVIYFSGDSTVTYLNVTYGTTNTNYSYVPNHINLFGENVTLETDGNVTFIRETEYQQFKKFYWTKYTDTLYYTATVSIFNPFSNVNVTEVYSIIEFANDTTPDYVTATLYDVSNGVYLTKGENYFTTASGIHFYLDSLASNTTRQFTGAYYATKSSQVSSDAVVIVDDYQMKYHENTDIASGTNWYYVSAQWVNPNTNSFVGSINVQFNFDTTPYTISSRSFDIYDRENGIYLDRDDFVWTGSSVIISQDAVGTVVGNGARTFEIYFLFVEEDEEQTPITEAEEWIKSEAFYGIQWFYIIMGALILMAVAFGSVAYDKRRSWVNYQREAWLSAIFVFFIFVLIIWYQTLP